MKPTFWQRLDALARGLAPFSLTLILAAATIVLLSTRQSLARLREDSEV